MKTFLTFIFLSFALQMNSQKLKEADVPSVVKDSYNKMYPHDQKVTWEKEKGNFEAEFMRMGNKGKPLEHTITLDANGNYVQEEVAVDLIDLPISISDYVKKTLGGKKVTETNMITLPTGENKFKVEVEKQDYIFDANGKFLLKGNSTDSDMNGKDD